MKKVLLLGFLFVFAIACSSDDENSIDPIKYDRNTAISYKLFTNAPADLVSINKLEIKEDSLKINFGASGCSGSTWKIKLIADENILETNPPQWNLRLSLKNKEECEAYITKQLTFDISNLKVEGDQVMLNFPDSDKQITFNY